MGTRKGPLILDSTAQLINSLLPSHLTSVSSQSIDKLSRLRLSAGILRFSAKYEEQSSQLGELLQRGRGTDMPFDDSAIVGVSASALMTLSLTSGSWVLVRDVNSNVQRLARVLILDPPDKSRIVTSSDSNQSSAYSENQLPNFRNMSSRISEFCLPKDGTPDIDPQMAYLSPLLAFNLGLHFSFLRLFFVQGKEPPLGFQENGCQKGSLGSAVEVEIVPACFMDNPTRSICQNKVPPNVKSKNGISQPFMPRHASHLRISFVKVPTDGILGGIKRTSPIELNERQEMIDSALQSYFKVDRILARGDIFYIRIGWNCKSELCIRCSERTSSDISHDVIYFKVLEMEPSTEDFLCVNCNRTALVLGGSVPSQVPPSFMAPGKATITFYQEDIVRQLIALLTPCLHPSAFSFKFKTTVLLHGPAGCGKRSVVKHAAEVMGLHVVEYNSYELLGSSEKKTAVALQQAFNIARRYAPAILLLRRFQALGMISSSSSISADQTGASVHIASTIRQFMEAQFLCDGEDDICISNCSTTTWEPKNMVFLISAVDSIDDINPSIRRCFSHEICMSSPTEDQRMALLSESLQNVIAKPGDDGMDIPLKDVAGQTSGFMPRDIFALVADAGCSFVTRIIQEDDFDENKNKILNIKCGTEFLVARKNGFCAADLNKALERIKKRTATALGTPKVPNVKWEDIGGLEDVKKAILDTVQLPLVHKELFSSGLRQRSGVLLYGPPGTGKTLLAKAVATECSLNFLSVKGPELINMYIGESEKNVRDIFQKARAARPCVIFFDELDALAPSRGASGDSGGVMDRVVSQMLAEIDGLNETTQDLFIIGASNRPDLIDPALLRPGRFDKLLYVGISADSSYRERVLRALTRKFKLHGNVSLELLAKRCPQNFTGADMYALCADAWLQAVKRKVTSKTGMSSEGRDQNSITVEHQDFMKALRDLSPSLSLSELNRYEKLRQQFEGKPN
eukprot:TRINITY_DN2503_c0_g1_i1.p1 TRINITY_DN2503_c0_g1~~TRINITY_DN2503_c0_g1_i1.p1  ORF type:complete len:970 (+),score=216.58 TRINITY_DN2503_c0_g1_i1:125-3034(+)